MSLHETIVRALRNYPSLFQTRADVLHHLFVVNGCGYGWKNGRLVDVCGDDSDRPDDEVFETPFDLDRYVEEPDDTPSIRDYKAISRLREELRVKMENITRAFVRDNADVIARYTGDGLRRIPYPLCEYANLMTIPDDADAEHVAAAREVIFMIFKVNSDFDPNNPDFDPDAPDFDPDAADDFARTTIFAEKALASIQARFGKGEDEPSNLIEYQERRASRLRKFLAEVDKILNDDEE